MVAYSALLASGQSIKEIDQNLNRDALKKVDKLSEDQSIIEYSLQLPGNEEEK
jgi:hypothetical protein